MTKLKFRTPQVTRYDWADAHHWLNKATNAVSTELIDFSNMILGLSPRRDSRLFLHQVDFPDYDGYKGGVLRLRTVYSGFATETRPEDHTF